MLLREARGPRSMTEIAAVSGVPVETLRKIETGRIATPAFFTVAALAAALGLALEDVARQCGQLGEEPGLDGDDQARYEAQTPAGAAEVGNVRVLAHSCGKHGDGEA